jgi:hypothetical protein
MDAKKFREIEELYKDAKERQAAGEISAEDMKSELKKMMLRDEENRYWMLGGKTGSWYVHDGTSWNPADPYEREETPPAQKTAETVAPQKSQPAITIELPKKASEAPDTLCRYCQSRLGEHDTYCKFCGGSQKAPAKPVERHVAADEIQVRAVRLFSSAVFFGGLGLIAGVIFGASFGIFTILGDWIYQFPLMLQEMRGKFLGGLFFGAIGGIAGFFALALLGTLLAMLYNTIAFIFFGGLRFKIKS